MNRNRQGRDRGSRSFGGGDGLLGEGPGMGGGLFEPMVNTQMNQLLIAQQLLQQQAALGGAGGFGGDFGMSGLGGLGGVGVSDMHYLQQGMGYGGMGGLHNDRKRSGGQGREQDYKRRRRDSSGRSGDRDRSRGRDSSRSGEGKEKNRSNRWDSDKDQDKEEGEKGEDDYDPAEPTEDEEGGKDKDSNLYCHVCNVSVYDDESFRRHLNGMKHTQRMNSLLTVHQMKSNQLKSRLRAEEHLRKIEGKNTGDNDYFCKICNNSLTIPWERHRFSNIHRQRQLQVKRGCGWCKVHDFTNFTEVLEHRETEEHKKNAEVYGKKKDDSDRSRSRSRSRERRSDKHRHRRSTSHDHNRKDKDDEDDEDLTIPEFNPENPVGVKYVIPVTGFFCKLCHKFYNNEKSAKGSHCQSETHYEKFKQATEEKIVAREKRLAEKAAAEAAQKEEDEKRKEAEKDSEMDQDKEENEEKSKKDDHHGDDEDYDDELPLEDEDNEGGLLKDDEFDGALDEKGEASKDNTFDDSYMTATSADGSYYLPGDLSQIRAESLSTGFEDKNQELAQESILLEDTTVADRSTEDTSMDLTAEGPDKGEESVGGSDEESTPTPAVATKSPRGRGGTARRGRGKGKARK